MKGRFLQGLPKNQRTVLHEPYLFTYTARPGSQTIPIKMIALDGSPGWVRHLPLPFEELENKGLPRPAISADIVAIAYMTRSPTNLAQDGAHIELVDRSGGFRRSNLLLSPEMSKMSVRVYGLGDSLLILGSGISGNRNLSQSEVMQSAR